MNNNEKKSHQLGMPHGTANGKLHKAILFSLLKQLNQHYCYRCGFEIDNIKNLSIEHKIPYLDSEDPVKLFFDLDNIAFSHLSCNVSAARRKVAEHGTHSRYKTCRCIECVAAHNKVIADWTRNKRAKIKNGV